MKTQERKSTAGRTARRDTARSPKPRTTSPQKARKAGKDIGEQAAAPRSRRVISAEERRRMIAEAAYFRAQRRGFRGGSPEQDWLEAEAEVDATLIRDQVAIDAG